MTEHRFGLINLRVDSCVDQDGVVTKIVSIYYKIEFLTSYYYMDHLYPDKLNQLISEVREVACKPFSSLPLLVGDSSLSSLLAASRLQDGV